MDALPLVLVFPVLVCDQCISSKYVSYELQDVYISLCISKVSIYLDKLQPQNYSTKSMCVCVCVCGDLVNVLVYMARMGKTAHQ